jgi:hypothetical protein
VLNGDISNGTPSRIIVTYDYITREVPVPKKILGVVVGTSHTREIDPVSLSALSRLSAKVDVRLELAVFHADDVKADEILADLDRRSWQPFNYARGYESAMELVSVLPYRPEVLGVIDVADRAAGYGTYAISLDYLARAI